MNLSIMHRKAKGTNTAQSTMVAAKARLRLAMNDRVRKATSGTYNDWCQEVTPQWQWDAPHIEYIHAHLDKVTQGSIRKLMVNLPPRHSKCLVGSTPVLMADGTWKPIVDICPQDTVISIDSGYNRVEKPVVSTMFNGVRPVLKITLFSGRYVVCTENHPFLTVGGWVEAGNLSEGDSVAALRAAPMPDGEPLPMGYAALMGYLTGDGGFTQGQVRITNIDPDIIADMREIASYHGWALSKYDITYYFRNENSKASGKPTANAEMLRYVLPVKSKCKRVPDCLWECGHDDLVEFLAAYFNCDGSLNDRREGVASYDSVSELLLRDVQRLLTRLGIYSCLRLKLGKYKGKVHRSWALRMSGKDMVTFARLVPVIGRKGETLQRMAARASLRNHYPEYESIPGGWKEHITSTKHHLRRLHGIRIDKVYTRGTARHLVSQVAEIEDNDNLRELCKPDVIWERITKIEKLGDEPTYDIEVEDTHNFIADGIVVHNTESITVHYAAYRLELNPSTTILVVCHTQGLATKLSRKIRKLVDGRVELSKAKRSASEWETRAGGGVKAVGVMGVGGGLGFDVIICDDIIKSRKEANSPAFRSRINDAYKDDISTRLNPSGAMLMPFTRWHLQDIGGFILESEDGPNWTVIKLPALAEANDPLHRPEGKALWPERWDEAYLEERRQIMGPSFHPLYQQNPLLGGGDLFKAFWFADAIIPALPANCTYVRAWDKAATSGGTGAETAGVLMARTEEGQFIVCDVIHGRWSVAEREAIMKRTADADGYETSIWIEQEPGSGGKESAQSSVMNLSGYNVHTQVMSGEGDKRTRAEPMAAQAEVGNVKILQDTPIHKWNQIWISQASDFPQGNLRDVLDASSMAFNKLALRPPPGKPAVSGPRTSVDSDPYAETRSIWDR